MPRGTIDQKSTSKPSTSSPEVLQTAEQLALERKLFAGLRGVRFPADLTEPNSLQNETSPQGQPPQEEYDPIALAMKRHPGLTREAAEKMAEALGF